MKDPYTRDRGHNLLVLHQECKKGQRRRSFSLFSSDGIAGFDAVQLACLSQSSYPVTAGFG